MELSIDVEQYLSRDEIKDLCIEQVRVEISKFFKNEENAQRLLGNLSYNLVFDEIDKVVPNSRGMIAAKTMSILGDIKSYQVFRDASYGGQKSLGQQYMEQAVKDNKDLINERVRETIINKDFSEEVWTKFEELSDTFASNIYEIVRLGRKKD